MKTIPDKIDKKNGTVAGMAAAAAAMMITFSCLAEFDLAICAQAAVVREQKHPQSSVRLRLSALAERVDLTYLSERTVAE